MSAVMFYTCMSHSRAHMHCTKRMLEINLKPLHTSLLSGHVDVGFKEFSKPLFVSALLLMSCSNGTKRRNIQSVSCYISRFVQLQCWTQSRSWEVAADLKSDLNFSLWYMERVVDKVKQNSFAAMRKRLWIALLIRRSKHMTCWLMATTYEFVYLVAVPGSGALVCWFVLEVPSEMLMLLWGGPWRGKVWEPLF